MSAKRAYIQGMIAGVALAAAAMAGYAYGELRSPAPREGEVVTEAAGCTVRVGYGSLTPGNRCYRNEVMVGVRDDYILCADITVRCE